MPFDHTPAPTSKASGFDARTAKSMLPGTFLTFDNYPGLRFEVTTRNKSWIYRYKSPTTDLMKQYKIGAWPALSFNAAIVKWEELREIRTKNRCPAYERDEQRVADKLQKQKARLTQQDAKQAASYTVAKLVQDYLHNLVDRNRGVSSATNMRRLLESIPAETANLPATTLSRKQAYALIESRAETPVAANTMRQELSAAWEYALNAELIPEETPNWWHRIMKGKKKFKSKGKKINGKHVGAQKRVLSEAEIGALILWLPNFASQVVADILTLYLWTGTRGGEIVAMEAREITLADGILWWTIPKAKTKNAHRADAFDLRVPLFGRARVIVERRLKQYPTGFLFPSKRTKTGHFAQTSVGDAVNYHQPYCCRDKDIERPRLDVTYWAPHDLRRTARTVLASIECPSEVAEAILGHMQAGICGVYNLYAYDKERVKWLAKLDEHLEQVIARGKSLELSR